MWRSRLVSLVAFCIASAPLAANDSSVPMRVKPAGTYYVEGEIAGMGAVEFLVDTGSGYTAINSEMLAQLEQTQSATYLKQLVGVMADGSEKVVPVYLIPEIKLGNCVIRNVEAAVFATTSRPILGMRSLSKVSPFTFSTSPPALRMGGCAVAETLSAAAPTKDDTAAGVNMAKMEPPVRD